MVVPTHCEMPLLLKFRVTTEPALASQLLPLKAWNEHVVLLSNSVSFLAVSSVSRGWVALSPAKAQASDITAETFILVVLVKYWG